MRFRVLLHDGFSDCSGEERDAAWEAQRGGELRVIEFEPTSEGRNRVREALLCSADEWVEDEDD